ncbi:MAG: hypothetical protein NC400_07985 [Clostridium sp.]|nr:hypothetical protein [Clostridium sp.]
MQIQKDKIQIKRRLDAGKEDRLAAIRENGMFKESRGWKRIVHWNRARKLLWLAGMAAMAGLFPIKVWAVPAALKSQSAVVYGRADGESSPVGNLVQEGPFEYVGDVTGEDGRIWRQVVLPGGITGYIQGNVEIERPDGMQEGQAAGGEGDAPEEEGAGEEEDGPPEGEEEGERPQAAGEGNGERPGGTEGGNNRETPLGEAEGDREAPGGDGEGLGNPEGGGETAVVENHRAKSYEINAAGRIKVKKEPAEDTDKEPVWRGSAGAGFQIDMPLLLGMAAAAACALTAFLFWKKLERMKQGNEERLNHIGRGFSRRNEKRKYSQHGKTRKKRRGARKGNGKG